MNCFNPLPTQRPGETTAPPPGPSGLRCFNPLPTQRPGETGGTPPVYWADPVSIRSRRRGREKLSAGPISAGPISFQSAPDAEAGRNTCSPAGSIGAAAFQSAPDAEAGRNAVHGSAGEQVVRFQSAPDAEAGRNLWLLLIGWLVVSFNPLPTQRPGETIEPGLFRGCLFVSIRSRRRGREKHPL